MRLRYSIFIFLLSYFLFACTAADKYQDPEEPENTLMTIHFTDQDGVAIPNASASFSCIISILKLATLASNISHYNNNIYCI